MQNLNSFSTLPDLNKPDYQVKDLYLAATLLCMKFQIIDWNIQYEGAKQQPIGFFTFKTSADLLEAVKLFYAHQASVEPIEFSSNIKNLKSQVMAAATNPLRE